MSLYENNRQRNDSVERNENVLGELNVEETWTEKYKCLMINLSKDLMKVTRQIPSIKKRYNPLEFAAAGHEAYLDLMPRHDPPKYLFIGMNPGPHGSQRGIPFGSKTSVENILKIQYNGTVPFELQEIDLQYPPSSDYSGKFWNWVEQKCGYDLEKFFSKCFVFNYCPLLFFDSDGYNMAMNKIPGSEVTKLCDDAVKQMIELTGATHIIAIGDYVHGRVLPLNRTKPVHCMPHPARTAYDNEYKDLPEDQVIAKWIKSANETLDKKGFDLNF